MSPAEARQAITARIAALVPDASYQQGAEAWTEAKVPLVPEFTPEPAAQLSFYVDNRVLTLIPSRASAVESLYTSSVWVVRFLYRLRASSRVADWDLCSAAEAALWRHLLAWELDQLRLVPSSDFVQRRILGDWIVSELRFYVQFPTDAE